MNKTRNKPRRGERELGVIYRDLSGGSRASQQVRAEFNRRDPRKTRRAENKAAGPVRARSPFHPPLGKARRSEGGEEAGRRPLPPPRSGHVGVRAPSPVPPRRGSVGVSLTATSQGPLAPQRRSPAAPGGPRRTARLTQTGPSGAPPKGRGPNSSVAAFIHRRFAQKKLAEERTRRTPPPGRYPRPAPAQRRRQAALRRGGDAGDASAGERTPTAGPAAPQRRRGRP